MKRLIPNSIKEHYRLLRVQKKFGKLVNSYDIDFSVTLGEGVRIAKNVDLRKNVAIGDYSYVNKGTLIASGTIGKYCSIGYNCQIGIFEHPTNLISTSPQIYRNDKISEKNRLKWSYDDINNPPKIGNDVWIGSNSIIMQNVRIGDGAIIAGGAVVTKDVEPYSIVGGVPAKIIRKRFSEKEINLLLRLEWWNKEKKWIDQNIDKFIKPKEFIDMIRGIDIF